MTARCVQAVWCVGLLCVVCACLLEHMVYYYYYYYYAACFWQAKKEKNNDLLAESFYADVSALF